MKKDIPEIGDLTQGINDSDIILTHELPEMLEKSSGLQDRTNDTSENLSFLLPKRCCNIIALYL